MHAQASSKTISEHAKTGVRFLKIFATDCEGRLRRAVDNTKVNLTAFTGV